MKTLLLILIFTFTQLSFANFCEIGTVHSMDSDYNGRIDKTVSNCDFDNEAKPAEKLTIEGCDQPVVRHHIKCQTVTAHSEDGSFSLKKGNIISFVAADTMDNTQCKFATAMKAAPYGNTACVPSASDTNVIANTPHTQDYVFESVLLDEEPDVPWAKTFGGDVCADLNSHTCLGLKTSASQ